MGWLFSSQGVRDYVVRRREHRRLEEKLAETRARVADKQMRLNRAAKDDAFLELEARRNLGLVKPDEVEFRFKGEKMEKTPAGK